MTTISPPTGRERAYATYVLVVLVLVYTLNVADRSVIAIIQEALRKEFGWADWQLGLLGGAAFGLFYSFIGIPVARLAERANRAAIISGSIALWSAMTALCGMVSTLPAMLIARIGVGVGEAGCTPPAHSLISDYFAPERRNSALSVYSMGMTLGPMVAAIGGGALLAVYGWRSVFLIFGAIGIALAALTFFTIREPARTAREQAMEVPNFASALRVLLGSAPFRQVVMGAASANFVNAGMTQFLASFFVRSHDLSLQVSSLIFGVAQGLVATLGILAGGFAADRLRRRDIRAPTVVAAVGCLLAIPFYLVAFKTTALALAVTMLMGGTFFQWLYISPLFGVVQEVAHPRTRATATALTLFVGNLVGYVLGPPVIGLLSDLFAGRAAVGLGLAATTCTTASGLADAACAAARAVGLQHALLVFTCVLVWPALHFGLASRRARKAVPV